MKPTITNLASFLAVGLALGLGAVGCNAKSAGFPLSVQQVRQMSPTNSETISFEERRGEILVSVTDKYGDSHIHRLEFGTLSKQQALDLLKQKQAELGARP
jgi:hypothetical protein